MPEVSVGSWLRSWAYALRTTNPPPDGPTDTVTRWLVATRAALLPMTLFSGLVAALAWVHVRQAGGLLVVGLAIGAVLRAL